MRSVSHTDLNDLCRGINSSFVHLEYFPRRRLTSVALPGSGDFHVFDDELVLFLHYAGDGTNASFETTDDPQVVQACRRAFATAWDLASPFQGHRAR